MSPSRLVIQRKLSIQQFEFGRLLRGEASKDTSTLLIKRVQARRQHDLSAWRNGGPRTYWRVPFHGSTLHRSSRGQQAWPAMAHSRRSVAKGGWPQPPRAEHSRRHAWMALMQLPDSQSRWDLFLTFSVKANRRRGESKSRPIRRLLSVDGDPLHLVLRGR